VELVEAAVFDVSGLRNVDQLACRMSAFMFVSSEMTLDILRCLGTQSLQCISLSSDLLWVYLGTVSEVGIQGTILVGLVRISEEVLAI
jgi:hypothetical protein